MAKKDVKPSKEEVLEAIKNEKKPAIVVRVPGFSDMNSGPMSDGNDVSGDDDE